MSAPKPFQDAAVKAALAAFADRKGRRRFLVADEVGLGKTIVAKELARHMSEDGRRPLVIYYVANGHGVSHQNKGRIVGFLGEAQRKAATATPDRLSLVAITKRPDSPVLIYALTPATSFPGARARLTGGRKEERAFLKVLLEHSYPAFARGLDPDTLRLSARGSWDGTVKDAERKFAASPPRLRQRFREALAAEFGEPVRAMLDLAVHGDAARKLKPLKPTTLAGRLRRALALATLRHQPPDLVILDEFQRYRQILDEKDADPLLKALLDPAGAVVPPAILLLSATPYRLLNTRWEEARGALAHAELLGLVALLAGPDVRARAKTLFSGFGDKLRDIAAHSDATHPELAGEVDEAARLRDELRNLLTPVMSRTERDSVASADPLAATQFLDADPSPEDFQVYRHLVEGFADQMRYEALPYWSSVPLPAQSLGPRYAAWKHARFKGSPNFIRMTRERRNKLDAPTAWPDAKLRALSKVAPPKLLSLPWVAPSFPWWPLAGEWKGLETDPKLLMFSRFRATPPSVAALLSFGVEAHSIARKHGGYDKAYKRRRLKLAAMPGPVMAAFHPSPWLIRNTDPLAKVGATLGAVRKEVRRQILAVLPKGIIERSTVKARRRHRSIARVLASIEQAEGIAEQSAAGWSSAIGDDRAARAAVKKWRMAQPIDRLSPVELSDLVDYAIGAPGVALGRALLRHDPTILDPERYPELVRLCWQGLRNYLDNPVILSSLPGKSAVEQVMGAVVDGGFESVLDEHFWLRTQNLQEGAAGLARDLQSSLGLRAGSFSFHGVGGPPHKISVRCHVAVPFGDAETEPVVKVDGGVAQAAPARPDEVRRSFDTPFWPHVLATTSVGQEGLDFHPWCSHVVHWDLSSNPLDIEQREGRIQRYAGLAVRRRLAAELRDDVLTDPTAAQDSLWLRVERHADRLVDASGLRPWWVLDGAEIRRHVFERPFGRDIVRFARLREQRMIYRLALGQPNQEDFIDVLSRGGIATRALLQPLVLDLSAMGLRQTRNSNKTGSPAPGRGQVAIRDRAMGALVGLAVGDAVGTTLEFTPKPDCAPLSDMVGGGPFGLEAGQWTDDTAMALALADSLLAHPDLDPVDLMTRFVDWHRNGSYSCTGTCFDIGNTTVSALDHFTRTGGPIAGSTDPRAAGNGALMRLSPVAIRHWRDRGKLKSVAMLQTRTTHGAAEAVEASALFAEILADAIAGKTRTEVLAPRAGEFTGKIAEIATGGPWRGRHRDEIIGTGYVCDCLNAALWAVSRTTDFRSAVLLAANLGQDADTTAAVTGQLAGALYGLSGIPENWLQKLAWRERIEVAARELVSASEADV